MPCDTLTARLLRVVRYRIGRCRRTLTMLAAPCAKWATRTRSTRRKAVTQDHDRLVRIREYLIARTRR